MTVNRRQFLAAAGLPALAIGAVRTEASGAPADAAADRSVHLSGDGVSLTPAQYAALVARLLDEKAMTPDSYSLGGIVEELEAECARALGKERAIFMPTGTLANHMAVRALAGAPGRVVVQEQSHFYQDEGDCAQTLSNLTLMPLAPGRATFTADDLQHVLDQTKGARVVSRVSVLAVETPVRRKQGEHFDAAELSKIVALARHQGIRLHLDGARLFLQAAYTGENVADYAKPFDTVYVSLYKYFNAASGAILAGPREIIDGMFHGRRMFGGGLNAVWPFALVARHYFDGFSQRYATAVRVSEDWIRALQRQDAFAVERIPSGTNLFRLKVRGTDPAAFRKRLAARGVMLAAAQGDSFLIGANETLNRTTATELADAFARALTGD
jgi:threonine aldolase